MTAEGAGVARPQLQVLAALLKSQPRELESTISGVSMAPTIPDGAKIRICAGRAQSYALGTVVVCMIGEGLFAHRVVHCNDGFVLTQGDGWILCDPPTRVDAVLGVVTGFSAGGEWAVPGAAPSRGAFLDRYSSAQVALVRASLALHPEFARRVAGTLLSVASLGKLLWRRLGAGA